MYAKDRKRSNFRNESSIRLLF